MKTFADEFLVPPGGWVWTHPESKAQLQASDFHQLIAKVRAYHAANNFPIPPGFNQRLVNDFCERLPTFCVDSSPPSPLEMARNLAKSLSQWAMGGFATVTPEELQSRLETCDTCEFWAGEAAFGMGRCLKCGCTGIKMHLRTSKCPINKWKV